MIRPVLYVSRGELPDELVHDVLGLVGVSARPEAVAAWAPLERAVVVDWAVREHLSASDNPVRRRPRPSLLDPV